MSKFWDFVLQLDSEKNQQKLEEAHRKEDERIQRTVQKIRNAHPDEDCPVRENAFLTAIGESAYSIVDGKMIYDVCTCNKEK